MNYPVNYIDVEQGSPDWLAMRCGCIGASRVADACAVLKRSDGESAVRRSLRFEIICERLTGLTVDHYVSPDMERGTELEPLARAAYEIKTGVSVDTIGFVLHPSIKFAGASPDGLVGADGLMEIKCPRPTTHIDYWLSKEIPALYQPQMLWQMACTGRQWCDFVSYCPEMPKHLQLFVVRFPRDDKRIEQMEAQVKQFLAEVEAAIASLAEVSEDPLHITADDIKPWADTLEAVRSGKKLSEVH